MNHIEAHREKMARKKAARAAGRPLPGFVFFGPPIPWDENKEVKWRPHYRQPPIQSIRRGAELMRQRILGA